MAESPGAYAACKDTAARLKNPAVTRNFFIQKLAFWLLSPGAPKICPDVVGRCAFNVKSNPDFFRPFFITFPAALRPLFSGPNSTEFRPKDASETTHFATGHPCVPARYKTPFLCQN